jgi:hypothetical protein
MAFAAYTKLEAVNSMIADMGERPVSTIVDPARLDVVQAVATLDEVTRQEQYPGWWFNTELFELTVNGSGEYIVPAGFAKVDTRSILDGSSGGYPEIRNPTANQANFVVRNGKLYDTITRTDAGFSEKLYLVGVYILDFEDLPETAKRAFTTLASIQYQMRMVGSREQDAALRSKANLVRQELLREDLEQQDYNLQAAPRFSTLMFNR